jgi:hypothetical protein
MLMSLATACAAGPTALTSPAVTTTALTGSALTSSALTSPAVTSSTLTTAPVVADPAAAPAESARQPVGSNVMTSPAVDLRSGALTTTAPSPVRQGTTAPSARVRFLPTSIELPSGDTAVIEPAQTVDGVLQVPTDVQHVGWWDGSS